MAGFSRPQTSPRLSFSLRWAVFRDWVSVSSQELTALWNVPILILDCLSKATDVSLLHGFCLSAPAKVLFVGADALLTTLFCFFLLILRARVHQLDWPPRQMLNWVSWSRVRMLVMSSLPCCLWHRSKSSRGTLKRRTVRPCQSSTCGSMPFSASMATRATGHDTYGLWACPLQPWLGVC